MLLKPGLSALWFLDDGNDSGVYSTTFIIISGNSNISYNHRIKVFITKDRLLYIQLLLYGVLKSRR